MKFRTYLAPVIGLLLACLAPALKAQDIFKAIQDGGLAKIKALVEKDPRLVSALDIEGFTPLHKAAERIGATEIVAFLLEKGADVNSREKRGRTPLWMSVHAANNIETVKLLIAKGADINAQAQNGMSVLGYAVFRNGGTAIVGCLLEQGAALPIPGSAPMKQILGSAAEKGLINLVERLIAMGADLRFQDEDGNSLLDKAAAGGSKAILEILLQAGLSISAANDFGWTALHYAAEAGRREAVDILLEKGAALDARTIDGRSAFDLAREFGKMDVADFLAGRGADRGGPRFPDLSGPYFGQVSPGGTPRLFAVGIVGSRYKIHGNVVFSPAGDEAYWSILNYGGKLPEYVILGSKIKDGRWTLPAPAPFSRPGQGDDCPAFSPDGSKLFFISMRPLGKIGPADKERIWVMDRSGDGWSEPRPLPPVVNDFEGLHWNFSIARNGDLYFGAVHQGGYGQFDVYCSRFRNGNYSPPENLGPPINTLGQEGMPYIAPDESYLLFGRSVSFKTQEGRWGKPVDLEAALKLPADFRAVNLAATSDGKYLLFLAGSNSWRPYWVESGIVAALKPKD